MYINNRCRYQSITQQYRKRCVRISLFHWTFYLRGRSIIIIIISFLQGIYTHIPETNYVRREYSVAAILLLLFMLRISLVSMLNLLYFYINTFRSMCAVPNKAVFCSSLNSCFLGMLLTYFLNYFDIVPFPLLLLVSPLFLHSTCTVFLL